MNIEVADRSHEMHTSHATALLRVMFADINGKTGWRLPTVEECKWLFNNATSISANNRIFRSMYWTSDIINSETAYAFNFLQGHSTEEKTVYHNFVRPVRTITLEDSND